MNTDYNLDKANDVLKDNMKSQMSTYVVRGLFHLDNGGKMVKKFKRSYTE